MLREDEIKVIVSNQPTREKSEEKTAELCQLLGQVWVVENE